jgi:hypothetical protein
MVRKKAQTVEIETKFHRSPELPFDNHIISRGDMIKVKGEYGTKFRFDHVVTNTETGAVWVDCFETFRGTVGAFRSFKIERVKRIPKRRVKKNVNRSTAS